MTRIRKDYTQEFKDSAVKLITEQGYTISEAARNLGINVFWIAESANRKQENPGQDRPLPCLPRPEPTWWPHPT